MGNGKLPMLLPIPMASTLDPGDVEAGPKDGVLCVLRSYNIFFLLPGTQQWGKVEKANNCRRLRAFKVAVALQCELDLGEESLIIIVCTDYWN